MNLHVNEIGDGLFIELYKDDHLLVTDFGSQQSITNNQLSYFTKRMQQYKQSDFALSHFHKDHYSGLVDLDKLSVSLNLTSVLLPRLPQDPPVTSLFLALQAFNQFSLGGDSGSMDFDFLSLVGRLIPGGYIVRSLSQGDRFTVDGESFTVSWPPRHLTPAMLGKVSQAVREFHVEAEKIPQLNDLYHEISQQQSMSIYIESSSQEIYIQKNNFKNKNPEIRKPKLSPRQRGALVKINRKLKAAANRLSLCYFNEEVNFMGDLEANEIDHCLQFVRTRQPSLEWDVIVLPHHGTHWHPSMNSIAALVGVSSNGRKMLGHWKPGNKHISKFSFLTHVDGSFSFKY